MNTNNYLKRREELLNAVKVIASMSLQDMVNVAADLAKENVKLKQEFLRLKEDKEENDAMYEKTIENYKSAIDTHIKTEEQYKHIINTLKGGK